MWSHPDSGWQESSYFSDRYHIFCSPSVKEILQHRYGQVSSRRGLPGLKVKKGHSLRNGLQYQR